MDRSDELDDSELEEVEEVEKMYAELYGEDGIDGELSK